MSKTILITGASSGFGKLSVEALKNAGHTVIASMRDINGRNKELALAYKEQGVNVVEIDVTSDLSVEQGVQEAINQVGKLDVLINNAGIGGYGLVEGFTPADMSRLFDINVIGVQRMTKAILKHFHPQKSGYVLNVSSLLGRMTLPFYGPYNASKWALEALTENYRTELSQFGIDFGMVEPGGFPTSIMDNRVSPSDNSVNANYGDFAHVPQQALDGFEEALAANPAQDPALVANAIVELVNTPAGKRPFRTVVDKMGMGDPIDGYNKQLAEITTGVYTAFGIEGLLTLNTNEK
jgi:NAD(P)-dependent dehydrogenase (short-subunit alcohol dehydrogenase family)